MLAKLVVSAVMMLVAAPNPCDVDQQVMSGMMTVKCSNFCAKLTAPGNPGCPGEAEVGAECSNWCADKGFEQFSGRGSQSQSCYSLCKADGVASAQSKLKQRTSGALMPDPVANAANPCNVGVEVMVGMGKVTCGNFCAKLTAPDDIGCPGGETVGAECSIWCADKGFVAAVGKNHLKCVQMCRADGVAPTAKAVTEDTNDLPEPVSNNACDVGVERRTGGGRVTCGNVCAYVTRPDVQSCLVEAKFGAACSNLCDERKLHEGTARQCMALCRGQ